MKPNRFSRRRLLGTALAALTGWLGIRRSLPAAAPPRPIPPTRPPQIGNVTSYCYDSQGRLFAVYDVRHELPRPMTRLGVNNTAYDGRA